jgi:hypothetical protein
MTSFNPTLVVYDNQISSSGVSTTDLWITELYQQPVEYCLHNSSSTDKEN